MMLLTALMFKNANKAQCIIRIPKAGLNHLSRNFLMALLNKRALRQFRLLKSLFKEFYVKLKFVKI